MDGSVEDAVKLHYDDGGVTATVTLPLAPMKDILKLLAEIEQRLEDRGLEDSKIYERVSCHVTGLSCALLDAGVSVD